ncbi:MAG: alkaline phosphatase family protein [Peptococcaceae bacterium]|nr:alkaline phosphatase family protein [Peptococcaceae bacterium]
MLRNGKVLADKMMVLGVDGMDPRLTRKYIDEGKVPNLKKLAEMGAQRHDLVMLGAQPTVTPPQWTTLAVGANPCVHGITQFGRTVPGKITQYGYNVDSRIVKAEQVWNCFAEGGYNTCVFHWPGGAWPPTSDSEHLFVIDGSCPGSIGAAAMTVDSEMIVDAGLDIQNATFVVKELKDAVAPCVIDKLPDTVLEVVDVAQSGKWQMSQDEEQTSKQQDAGIETIMLVINDDEGFGTRQGDNPTLGKMATAMSPIKEASGWVSAPEGAKEFTVLLSKGLVRRVGLILKNEQGIYDKVAVYKSKKEVTPLVTCEVGKMEYNVIDEVIYDDKQVKASRHYRLISLEPDGSHLKLYISNAMDMTDDKVIHPKRLHKALIENAGPFPPQAQIYTQDKEMQQIMIEVWDYVVDWYCRAFDYLIENEGMEMIFSHLHSIDFVEHTFIRHMKNIGFNNHDESEYAFWMERLYQQVDRYVGYMMKYLDEGWTIFVTADHAQVAPSHIPPQIGDMCGINVGLMRELGYTVLQKDENGNELRKIDWTKTRAIASQGNDIFINLKGREKNGIVEPEDQYELEEQIMTDLYGYKHPDTGKRVIAMALRNKDAILLGYGGPTAGDICFWVAEGYNYDHCDSLSTAYGEGSTSASPLLIAAGKGLKQGYETDRWIRQVDLAPTMCIMGGVRIPAQCEGAPIYQILAEEL